MENLWSPWRMNYIMQTEKPSGCVFCAAASQPDSAKNLIVQRGKLAFVILNRYPYTSAHLMVVPYEHQSSIEQLPAEARTEMMEWITLAMQRLRQEYHPEAFNVGANIGAAAGAGIVGHVHFHIVPRWGGDTNFMSTVGQTRVLPEALEVTYERLKSSW
jgi:ATP adenylyltransferase